MLIRLSLVFLLLVLAACERELPKLPEFTDVGPYLHQPECVACLGDVLTACLEDADCQAQYECRGGCGPTGGPTCHHDCIDPRPSTLEGAQAFVASGGGWGDDLGAHLNKKAADDCRSECAIGRDLRCVGQYRGPSMVPVEVELGVSALDVLDGLVPGMEVSVCGELDVDCDNPSATHSVSAGAVEISVRPTDDFLMFAQNADFESADAGAQYQRSSERQTLPWGDRAVTHFMATDAIREGLWEASGVEAPFDVTRPAVTVVAWDCALNPAVDLHAATNLTAADCEPFGTCTFFWTGTELRNDLTKTGPGIASVTFSVPPSRTFTAQLVDNETGRVVTELRPNVPKSTQESWWAYPLTRQQLAELESLE